MVWSGGQRVPADAVAACGFFSRALSNRMQNDSDGPWRLRHTPRAETTYFEAVRLPSS